MPRAGKALPRAASAAIAAALLAALALPASLAPCALAADATGRSGLAGAADALRNELSPLMLTFDKRQERIGADGAVDITAARVQGLQDVMYTGQPESPTVTLKLGDRTLRAGEDFDIEFSGSAVDPGTVAVTITGKGTYTGVIETSFTILPGDLSYATVDVIPDQTATGEAICPEPTVKLDGQTLAADVDYTVTYESNVEAGTAFMYIEGIGNCGGETHATFEIVEGEQAETRTGIPAVAVVPAVAALAALAAVCAALVRRRRRERPGC